MNRKGSSGLFLMEMIVAVFFFVVCASTCILAFAKSDSMSRLAKDKNGAAVAAQSVVEIWKAEGTDGLENRLGLEVRADEGFGILWDKGWQPRTEGVLKDSAPAYTADVTITDGGEGIERLQVSVSRYEEKTPLFELEAARYRTEKQRAQEGQ